MFIFTGYLVGNRSPNVSAVTSCQGPADKVPADTLPAVLVSLLTFIDLSTWADFVFWFSFNNRWEDWRMFFGYETGVKDLFGYETSVKLFSR